MVNNQRNAVSWLVTGFCRRSKRFRDAHERDARLVTAKRELVKLS
jgi:hypothetical protein